MDIPNNYCIFDTRSLKDLKGITISGYKRQDVLNIFQNSIINYKLEDAITWCVELHTTGLDLKIWGIFKNIYFKYIHIHNPKIFLYILNREKDYNNIIRFYPKKHHIFTKNNQEIRNLYAELTAILTLTKKNNLFINKSLPIINNLSYNNDVIKKRLISKNMNNIINFINNNTSNEEKLSLNEIINNLKDGTFENCIYWYLWLEKIENNKKKDIPLKVTQNLLNHWITVLWNIILSFESNLEKNDIIFIKKLKDIYFENFKLNEMIKKKYFFFISFYIIKNGIKWKDIKIYTSEYLIIQTNANINKMYLNIKNNIELNLSNDSKRELSNKYFYLLNSNLNNNEIKIVKNTQLNNDINKVLSTKHNEYSELIKNNNLDNNLDDIQNSDELVSKNMNLKDLKDKKDEIKNKKIDAFNQFIIYKNKSKKSVIDYYKMEEMENPESTSTSLNIKNIIFSKRK